MAFIGTSSIRPQATRVAARGGRPPRHGRCAVVLALACGGCVNGAIDHGDPVDYALACAVPITVGSTNEATAPAMAVPGEFVLGPEVAVAGSPAFRTGYLKVTPDPAQPILATGTQRTVYLNRNGAKLTAGYDDAARNVSSVLQGAGRQSATVPKANFSDADWLKIVACVADEFARFNLQIVAERPAEPGFMMAMVGGTPGALGLPQGVGGIAPIDRNGCTVIEGAVTYIFSDALPGGGVNLTCEVAAQEIAHAFSLDHELLASDPMTYLDYQGHKVFQDQDADCGEARARACACRRPKQNSVKVLAEKAGLFQDPAGPSVSLTSPDDGATLAAGALPIIVHAAHPTGIKRVTLHYRDAANFVIANCGGRAIGCVQRGEDYTFTIPAARGLATFWAEAADPAGDVNVTHPRIVSAGPGDSPDTGAIRIAVSVDLAAFAAERQVKVKANVTSTAGAISDATLVWTDRRGVISENAMCSGGADSWARAMKLAPLGGSRALLVQANDSQGNHAASPRFSISADF